MEQTRNRLIKFYYSQGLHCREILGFLSLRHNINVSERQLKRIFNQLGLYRRKDYSSFEAVYEFIQNKVSTSSMLHGYRWMHLKCLQSGLVVTQETVRNLLKVIDPQGVSYRKRKRLRRRQYYNKGPNYLWHIDSYDKLKPYGIEINGCIDGFSRYVIWLEASYSNSDPRIISGYYLKAIELCNGCPQTVRTDLGTENRHIELLQTHLRENDQVRTHLPGFIYGTSPHNQRIEAWWSILRKHNAQYWMNLFEHLKEQNNFNGTFIDKSLVAYCFLNVIQEELDEVTFEWNSHRIAGSRNSRAPVGRPVVMYNLPEIYETTDYAANVSSDEIALFRDTCIFKKDVPRCRSIEVYELCEILKQDHNYQTPTNAHECTELYVNLRNEIYGLLE